MILSQLRSSFIWTLMLFCGVFLSVITIAHAGTSKDNQSSSEQLENTLVLNQGRDQHVTAHNLKESNGNKTFQSKLKIPGVSITEQVHQQTNGRTIQENKIIVDIAKNESVEFVQQFDGEGRKVSRSGLGSNGTANPLKAFLWFLMVLTHHVSPHLAWQRNIVRAY
ncbi:hypothetical protein TUM19329_36480 (plasmid) [Legionella antarctica]|uniref:Uncharacterized protein n=1 Tax=Legionella antarctica TaxID=2708020 RepID=A0A6F8TAZ5_9GAMM|nr:hypothetical protein [Legionella antarctica]BCA97287.1 hypothetical protein TUM19329_36480 [Legionella antarctica]